MPVVTRVFSKMLEEYCVCFRSSCLSIGRNCHFHDFLELLVDRKLLVRRLNCCELMCWLLVMKCQPWCWLLQFVL